MAHELTEQQMEQRFALLAAWKIGYTGQTVNDISTAAHVFFAKFIHECHPDLSLGESEDKLCEMFVSIIEPWIGDQIERGLSKAARKASVHEDMIRAVCWGLAMRYTASKEKFTAEAILKSAPKAIAETIKAEANEPQWHPSCRVQ